MSKDIPKKILDATLEVIAREKISGTRMRLIAQEAEMTQSNLHYYFPTKKDLFIALLDNIQDWFSNNRKRHVDPEKKPFSDNLHAIFEEKKDVILNNKKLDYVQFDYWVQGTVNPEIRADFQKTFDIWRKDITAILNQADSADESRSNCSEMLPYLMVSLMMGASMQYLIDEGKFDLDQYFALAEEMVSGFIKNEAKE